MTAPSASPRLSRETVVARAVAVIERDGFEAFSMRGLARDLGVHPAAVYWHIADRAALLAEVTGGVLAEVPNPDDALPWDVWLVEYARGYRRVLQRHPRIAPLINNLGSNTTASFPSAEGVLFHLHRAGFRGQALVDAYNVFLGTVIGFVTLELAPRPTDADPTWATARQDELEQVDAANFPTLAEHRPLMANRAFVTRWVPGNEAPLDSGFEALLDVVVTGLRARLASP